MTSAQPQPSKEDRFAVAEQFEEPRQQLEADLLGMWLFIATEVLMFGGLFLAFTVYRTQFGDAFAAAAGHLHFPLGVANTVVLLTSGVTMSLADPAARHGRRRRLLAMLAATMALGALFLGIKGYEYAREFHEGLVPLGGLPFRFPGTEPEKAELFFGFYFAMTGLHAVHMTVGLAVLAILAVLAWRWRDPDRLVRQVRIAGMYWAFVDIVWMFLFTALYLLHG